MKKVVSLAVAAATLVGSAVADITFGSWGRGNWIVMANQINDKGDGNDIVMGSRQGWGGANPRTALSVHGNGDVAGFNLDIFSNAYDLSVGDNAYIWVKPIEQVKLSIGKHDVNTFRGDACFGLWDWIRIGTVSGKFESEGFTFGDTDKNGVELTVTPIENLTLFAALGLDITGNGTEGVYDPSETVAMTVDGKKYKQLENGEYKEIGKVGGGKATKATEVLGRNSTYAMAYTLPELATIKLGLFTWGKAATNKDGEAVDQNIIQVAADVVAVENLFLSIGAKIPTVIQNKDNKGEKVQVNAYARFKATDELTAHVKLASTFCDTDKKKVAEDGADKKGKAVGFAFAVGADYAIDDTLTAFADIEYATGVYQSGTSADNADCFTLGLGVWKNIGPASLGVAFEGATNDKGAYKVYEAGKGFAWNVPVRFQYCF